MLGNLLTTIIEIHDIRDISKITTKEEATESMKKI